MGWWKNTLKFFNIAINPINTLENKHVVISWSSASASVSDDLAPVVQKLDSALVPVRRFPSPCQSIHYGDVSEANERTMPRDPKFGLAK